MVGIIVN